MDKQNNEIAFYRPAAAAAGGAIETLARQETKKKRGFVFLCFFRLLNGIELEKLASARKRDKSGGYKNICTISKSYTEIYVYTDEEKDSKRLHNEMQLTSFECLYSHFNLYAI